MKEQISYIGGVGSNTITTHSTINIDLIEKEISTKIFLLKTLKNRVYRNIYYMCFLRGFAYKGEVEKLLLCKITTQLDELIKYGVLEQTQISSEYATFLYSLDGFNYHNVNKIKIFSFSKFGNEIFSKYKDFITQKASKKAIEYINKENLTKDYMKNAELKRYQRIMMKDYSLRTIDDMIFIENFKIENGNIN